jgi:hypothetical protein
MTSTTYVQGCRNALICSAGLAVAWLSLAVVLSLILGRTVVACWGLSFAWIWAAIFVTFAATWLYGRKAAGRVLLNCGAHPTWWLFLAIGLLMAINGISRGSGAGSSFKVLETVASSVTFLFFAMGRLQVRENGIWGYWGLLRWSKIKSYHWAVDSTLFINGKGFASLLGLRAALPVPPKQKQAVDDLLNQFCPSSQAA